MRSVKSIILRTQDAEYVVKEKSVSTDGFLCRLWRLLNLAEPEAKPWSSFGITDSTIEDAAKLGTRRIRLDGGRMYRNQEEKCRDIADKHAGSNSEAVHGIYVRSQFMIPRKRQYPFTSR